MTLRAMPVAAVPNIADFWRQFAGISSDGAIMVQDIDIVEVFTVALISAFLPFLPTSGKKIALLPPEGKKSILIFVDFVCSDRGCLLFSFSLHRAAKKAIRQNSLPTALVADGSDLEWSRQNRYKNPAKIRSAEIR